MIKDGLEKVRLNNSSTKQTNKEVNKLPPKKKHNFMLPGIYMTSSIQYASKYAKTKADQMNKGKKMEEEKVKAAILICATIPGNTFPVPDMSLYGKPVQNGYQSHFTIGRHCFSFSFTKGA